MLFRVRLGQMLADRLFSTRPAGLQHVQADPGGDRGQPSGQVLHVAGAGPAHLQPCLLHRVFGLTLGAEHPPGDRLQAAAVLLEPQGQPLQLTHPFVTSFRRGLSYR